MKLVSIPKNKYNIVNHDFDKVIFDDSKIESHSALTPTYKIPKKENLTEISYKKRLLFYEFFCKKGIDIVFFWWYNTENFYKGFDEDGQKHVFSRELAAGVSQ
mgnify:CR=1 FL=1